MLRRGFLASSLAFAAAPGCREGGPSPRPEPTTGLDPGLLARAETTAAALPRLHSLIVARDGQVLFERAWRGPGLDRPANVKSASKSVLAALAGIAIGRGVVRGVDQPIADFLADRFPADPDPRLNAITVGHLLSMQAGLASTSGANYGAWVSSRDWVRAALARPFEAEPGGRLIYSTGSSHLLSAVLTRAAGRSTLALMRDWLGDPLGIAIPSWPADPQGVHFGGNEMRLSPRALLRIGELYLNDGVHEGARVLPEGWVEESWKGRGRSRFTGAPHGYGWWLKTSAGRLTAYAWGYGGQMVFVTPDLRLTTVMTSDPSPVAQRDDHVARLHDLHDRLLVAAAERGAGG